MSKKLYGKNLLTLGWILLKNYNKKLNTGDCYGKNR